MEDKLRQALSAYYGEAVVLQDVSLAEDERAWQRALSERLILGAFREQEREANNKRWSYFTFRSPGSTSPPSSTSPSPRIRMSLRLR